MSEAMIEAFDAQGRPVRIPREEWRTTVLPGSLRRAWDDPDALTREVTQGLQDGFAADVLQAAGRILELEEESERGGVLLAICLRETGQVDGAQEVLRAVVQVHPGSATGWTNLAQLARERGDAAEEQADIDRALRADPNYDVALRHAAGLAEEREGRPGWVRVMRETAGRDGAWRPQLWLGREALAGEDPDAAVRQFTKALDRAPDEPDALMQATGDLGNAGRLSQMLELGLPRYRPVVHGLPAGLNLLEASLQEEQTDRAAELLHRLYLLDRPDLRTRLAPYAERVDALRNARATGPRLSDDGRMQLQILGSRRSPWWRWLAGPDWLLPAAGEPAVAFLQLAAPALPGEQEGAQRTEWRGRLARGTAWYLADLVRFAGGSAAVVAPVVLGGGPILSPAEDDPASVARMVQAAGLSPRLVVAGTLGGDESSPTITLRVHAAPDWVVVATLPPAPPAGVWPAAAQALHGYGTLPPPSPLPVPADDVVARVISGYDTLSSFVQTARGTTSADALWGERASLDFLLDTATVAPADLTVLQFLASLVAMTAYGSPIPAEYRRRATELLQADTVATLTRRLAPLVPALLGGADADPTDSSDAAPADTDPAYAAWLARLTPPWWRD